MCRFSTLVDSVINYWAERGRESVNLELRFVVRVVVISTGFSAYTSLGRLDYKILQILTAHFTFVFCEKLPVSFFDLLEIYKGQCLTTVQIRQPQSFLLCII